MRRENTQKKFENNQDTTLLIHHLSLITLTEISDEDEDEQKMLPEKSWLHLSDGDLDHVVDEITSRLKTILDLPLKECNGSNDKLKNKKITNGRLHAVFFYKALKTSGLSCEKIDECFSLISALLPHFDWKLYIMINARFHWCDYFIEWIEMLPVEVVQNILKVMIQISMKSDIRQNTKYYTLHTVFQATLKRLLILGGLADVTPQVLHLSLEIFVASNAKQPSYVVKEKEIEPSKSDIPQETTSEPNLNSCDDLHDNNMNALPDQFKKLNLENNIELEIKDLISQPPSINKSLLHLTEDSEEMSSNGSSDTSVLSDDGEHNLQKGQLLSILKILLGIFTDELESSGATADSSKVVLHAFLTFFENLNTAPEGDSLKQFLFDLLDFYEFGAKYFRSSLFILEARFFFSSNLRYSFFYFPVSWGVSLGYLVFLLFCECQIKNNAYAIIKENPLIALKDLLQTIFKLFNESPIGSQLMEYVGEASQMLTFVIENEFRGKESALRIILSNPRLLQEEHVITCLEKSHSLFTVNSLSLLVIAFKEIASVNERLIQLYLKVLQNLPLDQYNEVLESLLNIYNQPLRSVTYNEQLSSCLKNISDVNQTEKKVLQLFIQDPYDVLAAILNRALDCGPYCVMVMIQAFRFVPSVCIHRDKLGIPLLISLLQPSFENKDCDHIKVLKLLEALIEVQVKQEIFSFDALLENCIFPNLNLEVPLKCSLAYKALDLSITLLNENNLLQVNKKNMTMLLTFLGMMINKCIITHNGKEKEDVLNVLHMVEQHYSKNKSLNDDSRKWLKNIYESFHPIVLFYVTSFLEVEPDLESLSPPPLWTWYCIKGEENMSFFLKVLSRKVHPCAVLIECLVWSLPHFTFEEWKKAKIILLKYFTENESAYFKTQLHPDSVDPKLYEVLRCFLDSVILINKNDAYYRNCFEILFKSFFESTTDRTYVGQVCLELNFMASKLPSDQAFIFETLLPNMLQIINTSDTPPELASNINGIVNELRNDC